MNMPQENPRIDLATSAGSFFSDAVTEITKQGNYQVSEITVVYVSGLLAEYVAPPERSHEALERSVTLLLSEARESTGVERFERFRRLGDGVLYTCGFFQEHLEVRGVELSYIQRVGAMAYEALSSMLGKAQEHTDVFAELSARFATIAKLIGEVAELLRIGESVYAKDIVTLYERWQKTGSARIHSALVQQGLLPLGAAADA